MPCLHCAIIKAAHRMALSGGLSVHLVHSYLLIIERYERLG